MSPELKECGAIDDSALSNITKMVVEIEDVIDIIEGKAYSIRERLSGDNGAECGISKQTNSCSSLVQAKDRLEISIKKLYGLNDMLGNIYNQYLR